MSLARVHAVLAAGIEHPRLLEQWRESPEALRALGVEPDAFDLAALAKFAGLSVKVRHNPLRAVLPLSFRLMSVAGIEIAMFSAYAAHRSRLGLGYAPTTPARARDLLEFLGGWCDPHDRAQTLLWDAIRYEEALARLGPWWMPPSMETAQAESMADIADRMPADAPQLQGEIMLLELRTNPEDLARALHASAPDLHGIAIAAIDAAPIGLCLWRAPSSMRGGDTRAQDVAVLTLDAFGYALLGLIDGRCTVATLARRLGGGRGATAAVREALRVLAGIGLVRACD